MRSWLFLVLLQLLFKEFVASDTNSTCQPGKEFDCGNGTMKCIPSKWKCDNVPDCENGADELNCTYSHNCPTGFMICGNEVCISKMFKCDGENDCSDGSDELKCKPSNTTKKYVNKLENKPKKTTTIQNVTKCREGFIKCSSKSVCIPNVYQCDGEKDCEDGSDELFCVQGFADNSVSGLHAEHIRACSEAGQFVCKPKNGKLGVCIPMEATCNGIKECPLGDDEPEKCTECSRTQCQNICKDSVRGARCICEKGFKLAKDGRSCEEEDHCALHGEKCQQFCENRPGHFVCKCADGYYLEENGLSCNYNKTAYPEGYLLIGGRYGARQIPLTYPLDAQDNDLIYKDIANRKLILEMMSRTNKLYIGSTESHGLEIVGELQVLEDDKLTVLRENIVEMEALAVDWITGNVYYVQHNSRSFLEAIGKSNSENSLFGVSVCTPDGRFCRHVFKNQDSLLYDRIMSFTLYPQRGLMFWIESLSMNYKSQPGVRMANMDGSNVQTFIGGDRDERKSYESLAVDPIRNDIYVKTDEDIERINLDTRKRSIVLRSDATRSKGEKMSYFNGYLYWFHFEPLHIYDVAHNSSSPVTKQSIPFSWSLTLNHSLYQPEPASNPCSDLDCPWICVVAPNEKNEISGKCLCPDGYKDSGNTCIPPAIDKETQSTSSYIGQDLMTEYCQSGVGCLNGGHCVFETLLIVCECPEHYDGLYCERLNPEKLVAMDTGSVGLVVLIVAVLLVVLILGIFAYFWISKRQRSPIILSNDQH